MLFVNDTFYDQDYFDRCNKAFSEHNILANCTGKRFTVCLTDAALWLAFCLYSKSAGASVFPLPQDTPKTAARRRAEKSRSHYLIFADNLEHMLESIETINTAPNDKESVLVQMSSGTTGEPKVIERSWSSIDIELDSYVTHFSEANSMMPVVACPVSHSYGLICGVLAAFKRGITPVVIQNFNPKYIIRKLQEVEKPILYSSPALITTITMLIKEDQPVHAIMTSGTLMQSAWLEQARKKTERLYQQYGCSEVGCIAQGGDIISVHDQGSVLPHLKAKAGKSAESPDEIVITTPDGKIVPTRDLGFFDKTDGDGNNRLHFISRIDDMINVAGLNVYPAEVEEVVMDMPEIQDAVVFKRQHSFGSDQVCLQFVANNPLEDDQIRSWCKARLASYQVPLFIEQVEQIDRLPNGKVSRKKLAEVEV